MENSDSPYIVESSEQVWSCPWFNIRKDTLTLPNDKQCDFQYVDKNPCVFVVPVTIDGQIVMIRNYRHPIKQWCWEVPAGGIKDGQSAEDAVKDELQEEVGGVADSIEYITECYLSNGTMNEMAHIFLATGVTLSETQNLEPLESIEVHLKSIAEAMNMARNGEITDAPSALALFLCEDRLK